MCAIKPQIDKETDVAISVTMLERRFKLMAGYEFEQKMKERLERIDSSFGRLDWSNVFDHHNTTISLHCPSESLSKFVFQLLDFYYEIRIVPWSSRGSSK